MKKFLALSFVTGILATLLVLLLVNFINLNKVVQSDHATLSQVVTFLNKVASSSQQASATTAPEAK